jgi:hypothetical protein
MATMREEYNFVPSKRAFQQQFRRWGFPSKQNPAHRNADLVARVKELWENNYTQPQMLQTLTEEGYEIKERELMRLRAKNRWLLRIPNGTKSKAPEMETMEDLMQQIEDAAAEHVNDPTSPSMTNGVEAKPTKEGLDEILNKRQELQAKRKAESDEKWASKKRRRRTKSYAGIEADPPGPPRFPSETTLDESKVILELDNKQYRAMRDQFQAMCEADGIIKKTLAGNEKWAAVKERLIQENESLQAVFWHDKSNEEQKRLALDVVCTDVTKRIRSVGRRMTIAEAKNVLGINPEQSRNIRNSFYITLKDDKFTSKLETGLEHWNELKQQWVASSDILQEVFAQGEADPQYQEKQKALEALCRDVMKRLRDDQAKGKSAAVMSAVPINPEANSAPVRTAQAATRLAEEAAAQPLNHEQSESAYQFANAAQDLSELQQIDASRIDPSLLAAGNFASAPSPIVNPIVNPIPIYIRTHPKSQAHSSDKMWLATLSTRSVQELRALIDAKWPDASLARIDGIERAADGKEISYLMEEDVELDAYLDHVNKATFEVQLNPGRQ